MVASFTASLMLFMVWSSTQRSSALSAYNFSSSAIIASEAFAPSFFASKRTILKVSGKRHNLSSAIFSVNFKPSFFRFGGKLLGRNYSSSSTVTGSSFCRSISRACYSGSCLVSLTRFASMRVVSRSVAQHMTEISVEPSRENGIWFSWM